MPRKIIKKTMSDTKSRAAAIILKNPQVAKQLGLLKGAAEIGVDITGKGLVIFYERSTRIGEIVKDIFFILTGVSILFAGIFAAPADIFAIWRVVARLEGGLVGRIIVIIAGIGLVTYAISKLWATLKLSEVLEKKEKFRQKKLV